MSETHSKVIPTVRGYLEEWKFQAQQIPTLENARGVSAGEVTAIAIRAYWVLKRQDLPETALAEAQIYFDRSLGINGYGWIFGVVRSEYERCNAVLAVKRFQPLNGFDSSCHLTTPDFSCFNPK